MRQFILPRYILREHFGPFCFSFAIITLIFILDLVFRHLSRILSKGLPLTIVAEFFGLNMAWIVATAVPMAVLTATLMAFGRLAADHEITAMQASGISLWRQVMPIFVAAAVLAVVLVWFNNAVLPDCNFRARVLAMDITRKKPGVKIEPGVWCQAIPNYGLFAKALEDSAEVTKVFELLIDDKTQPEVQRTISAHAGLIQASPHDGVLLFTLFNGEIQEINLKKLEEFRRLTFAKHSLSLKVDAEMFFQRSEANMRTDREKSITHMWEEVRKNHAAMTRLAQRINFVVGADLYHHLGRAFGLVPDTLMHLLTANSAKPSLLVQQKDVHDQVHNLLAEARRHERMAQTLLVEIHKKYAIPAACVVFVLIGAPLGVLARRGGLAAGAGLSLGFFLLYWACLIGGEDLADRGIASPLMAMWAANFFIGSLGLVVFHRIAAGKPAPIPFWLSRFTLPDLIQKFRRPQRRIDHRPALRQREHGETEPEAPKFFKKEEMPVKLDSPASQPAVVKSRLTASRAVLSPPQLEFTPVPEILRHFADRTRADLVLLADRNGIPLAHIQPPKWPSAPRADLEMIAKLASGQVAATEQIAQTVGECDQFGFIFQEGGQRNVFICQVSPDLILIAVVDKAIVIGWVRIQANEAVMSLRKILEII
jgi:lipopolysaccharide export system permease protein